MATHSCLGLRHARNYFITHLAWLIGVTGLIFVLVAAPAQTAHADWQAGGHQEPTYGQVCQDIANDWGGFFHPPQILSDTPGYDSSGNLGWYNCVVVGIFSYTVNGSPIFPICPAGQYSDATLPGGCSTTIPSNQCQCDGTPQPLVANPIFVATGNKFESVTDYTTAGQNPLVFVRYYNSLGASYAPLGTANYSGLIGYVAAPFATLGTGWRSNYEQNLTIVNSGSTPVAVAAQRASGQVIKFVWTGSVWQGDSDISVTLSQSGSTWTLTDTDDTVETYTNVNSTYALMTAIQARNGYTKTLIYNGGSGVIANGNNMLTSVVDSYSRTLSFTYQNGLLNTVTTPDGLVLTYGYNSSGLNPGVTDRLALVSYSTSPVTSQTYLYENTSFPFALTGIIDENGNRFATWVYDLSSRATSS